MARLIGAALAAVLAFGLGGLAQTGGDADATAVLDKAIKALGGEENLTKLKAWSGKAKGKIYIDGNETPFTSQTTVQGLSHLRAEFEAEFGGMQVKGVTVIAGDKGWRKFGDMGMDLDAEGLANEKRNLYLQVVPATLVPLKGQGFKVRGAGEQQVAGKPAVGVLVTGPDGKEFTLFFDKESGLPVKLVAKVVGFDGSEATQETTFGGLQGLWRDQAGHAGRDQARRRTVPGTGHHRVQAAGLRGREDVRRAQVTPKGGPA
jgi:hypothetical protein